jgi:hypothetical protein
MAPDFFRFGRDDFDTHLNFFIKLLSNLLPPEFNPSISRISNRFFGRNIH